MTDAAFPTITSTENWPPCHRVIVFPHQGPAGIAATLSGRGLDPILLRAKGGGEERGDYVLLPDAQAGRWDAAELAVAREIVELELIPTTHSEGEGETAAFVVAVAGPVVGRWAAMNDGRAGVRWTRDSEYSDTPGCDRQTSRECLIAAIRPTIPASFVSATRASLPATLVADGV